MSCSKPQPDPRHRPQLAIPCMPQYLQPKHSTQHRVAAIALYRALLSGCSSAPLRNDDRGSLRNAIRNKFRKNRKIQSSYQLGLSFKTGYDTLDYLDSATSADSPSIRSLSQLISKLPRNLTRSQSPKRMPAPDPAAERLACLPPERAVLNVRPYAKTSGPRHVPVLASANGIPFLRLTKPQPPALSRILRQRLERKQALFDTKVLLGNWSLPMARQEDDWDAIINMQAGKSIKNDDASNTDQVKWVDAIRASERENHVAYARELEKDASIVKKMQRIVDVEMELALKEGQTITRGRKKRPIWVMKPPPSSV